MESSNFSKDELFKRSNYLRTFLGPETYRTKKGIEFLSNLGLQIDRSFASLISTQKHVELVRNCCQLLDQHSVFSYDCSKIAAIELTEVIMRLGYELESKESIEMFLTDILQRLLLYKSVNIYYLSNCNNEFNNGITDAIKTVMEESAKEKIRGMEVLSKHIEKTEIPNAFYNAFNGIDFTL